MFGKVFVLTTTGFATSTRNFEPPRLSISSHEFGSPYVLGVQSSKSAAVAAVSDGSCARSILLVAWSGSSIAAESEMGRISPSFGMPSVKSRGVDTPVSGL